MPVSGNSYVVTLGQTHISWGVHRYTNSRDIIYNEVYLGIPSYIAERYKIYNSNVIPNYKPTKIDILGVNIFNCTSADGFFKGVLKSSGCSHRGSIYAKNLHGAGNLKALAPWLHYCNAQVGDHVEVTWTSPTNIVIRHF